MPAMRADSGGMTTHRTRRPLDWAVTAYAVWVAAWVAVVTVFAIVATTR